MHCAMAGGRAPQHQDSDPGGGGGVVCRQIIEGTLLPALPSCSDGRHMGGMMARVERCEATRLAAWLLCKHACLHWQIPVMPL